MIEKMTKYSFILMNDQTAGFLASLQEMGVMDITRSQKPVDEKSSALLEWLKECSGTISRLKKIDYSEDPDFDAIKMICDETPAPSDPISYFKEQIESLSSISDSISSVQSEIKLRSPWGDFDSEAIAGLSELGYVMHYYKVPAKAIDPQWEKDYAMQTVHSDGKDVWFVIVSKAGEEFDFPVAETAAPAGSVKDSHELLAELEEEKIKVKGHLMRAAGSIPALEAEYASKSAELDLYLANLASESAAEDKLNVIVGFAPAEKDSEIKTALDSMGIFYMSEAAEEEDNPPIKLKNNWFARQFEVLTGMYGMPVYGEFDPTPVLAPFFLLFFAMCMGDAGYGILLLGIGAYLKHKMGDTGLGKMHRLVTFLGAGTLVVGLFLGTFFGMSILETPWAPSWLKALCIDGWFPDGKIAGFPAQMVLAVGIGIIHICLAMIVKAIGFTKRFGIKSTISTWGWTLLIVGGIVLTALGMMEVLGGEALKWSVIALAVISGLAIYVFNTPGRNPLKNIGSGLWDTYNMVTGLLGDVLSYIRLYALGLAGGMLGNAFNIMGTMILDIPIPGINWIFCIVVLIFGHILNLAMSCLGAFVHPLRLTFVEYFKNSGYEGTGTAYNPLANNKTN